MENKNIEILNRIKIRASEAISDTKNMSYEEFLNDDKTIRASIFSISQIGESARLLDETIVSEYGDINWIEIRGLRNRIVHDYDGVQLKIVWRVIKENLPELIIYVDRILKQIS